MYSCLRVLTRVFSVFFVFCIFHLQNRSILQGNSLTRVKFDPLRCAPVGLVSRNTGNPNGISILSSLLSAGDHVIPIHTSTCLWSVVRWAVSSFAASTFQKESGASEFFNCNVSSVQKISCLQRNY
jgi:hypothetical protein